MNVPAKLFLCHAHEDEAEVERLRKRLLDSGLSPWMSTKDILPGEDWEWRIMRAMREADFILVCAGRQVALKRGFVQKEIKQALRTWEEKLADNIYLIPARLEDCPLPDVLDKFQRVDLFRADGYERLL